MVEILEEIAYNVGMDEGSTTMNRAKKTKVVYMRRAGKAGEPLFSSVALPDGTIVRRVDETVHLRALANADRRYREKLDAK